MCSFHVCLLLEEDNRKQHKLKEKWRHYLGDIAQFGGKVEKSGLVLDDALVKAFHRELRGHGTRLMGLFALPSKRSSPCFSRGYCQIKSKLAHYIVSIDSSPFFSSSLLLWVTSNFMELKEGELPKKLTVRPLVSLNLPHSPPAFRLSAIIKSIQSTSFTQAPCSSTSAKGYAAYQMQKSPEKVGEFGSSWPDELR